MYSSRPNARLDWNRPSRANASLFQCTTSLSEKQWRTRHWKLMSSQSVEGHEHAAAFSPPCIVGWSDKKISFAASTEANNVVHLCLAFRDIAWAPHWEFGSNVFVSLISLMLKELIPLVVMKIFSYQNRKEFRAVYVLWPLMCMTHSLWVCVSILTERFQSKEGGDLQWQTKRTSYHSLESFPLPENTLTNRKMWTSRMLLNMDTVKFRFPNLAYLPWGTARIPRKPVTARWRWALQQHGRSGWVKVQVGTTQDIEQSSHYTGKQATRTTSFDNEVGIIDPKYDWSHIKLSSDSSLKNWDIRVTRAIK